MELPFQQYMIRSWRDSDVTSLAKYANNRNIWLNLTDIFPHPYTEANAAEFIGKARGMDCECFFAIADANEAIGGIGISIKEDVYRLTGEMGYWLAEPFWGRGIVTGAIRTFTDFAFIHYALTRIEALPYAPNDVSARVLEKSGFECEGRLKSRVIKDEQVLDQFIYARIKHRR